MDLSVTLAGHRASWRYRGTRDLRDWIESQPWLRGGGSVLVRVGQSGDLELFLDAARRAVRAADDSGYQPELVPVTVEETLVGTMKSQLCGNAQADDRELANECSYRPRVVAAVTAGGGGEIIGEAIAFSDRARKFAPDYRVAFVVISVARISDDNALDFATGLPDDQVLRLLDDTQDRLFRAYLHARIAWEVGGSLASARELEIATGNLRLGDDEGLEAKLNEFALRAYGAVPDDAKTRLEAVLLALARNAPREAAGISSEPRAHGLLWSPTGRDRLRVVPWVARALLLATVTPTFRQGLRAQINCAPFARELLGRCLELEARERAKVASTLNSAVPPLDALARLESFSRGDAESDAQYYPNATPARPTDAWAFAEFGAFIDAAVRADAPNLPRRDLHGLRHLRNALAHGHYASWATLRRLMEIERRLGSVL